jgi:SAM-dependent methyltransferase
MRDDFCVFILTHGRPNNVMTYRTIRAHGYTGKIFIVIDDNDETGEEYKRLFGDEVLIFSKDEVSKYTDQMDNFTDHRAILWARNACWDLAKQMGYSYFVQLDDDYTAWSFRRTGRRHRLSNTTEEEYHNWTMIRGLDAVFEALVRVIETTPIKTIALSQGGDHMGGQQPPNRFRRKAMNSFVCSTEKPILFRGRLNDDVNTYTTLGSLGHLFFTDMELQLDQMETQVNTGGMSELYKESGTYMKSFYTVMTAPSCTTIHLFGRINKRLQHDINWFKAIPLIIPQHFKKASSMEADDTTALISVRNKKNDSKWQMVKSAYLIKTPPSKVVNTFLDRYEEMYPINKQFAKDIINQILRHRNSSKELPLPQYMLALEDKWYASLDTGTPDYSVYDDDYYFTEMWVCWAIYSRNYLRTLLKPFVYPLFENIKTVADLGCGIGYTTAGFKELFPSSNIVGTNVENTSQYEFCTAMGRSYNFEMVSDIADIGQADLVFASEYFEHILNPITHLKEVIATLSPKFLYVANSFNTRSAGHFNYYATENDWLRADKVQAIFNKTLKNHGYKQLDIKAWNNKPALWIQEGQLV